MRSHLPHGRLSSKNTGFGALRTALVAFSAFAISATSIWAQTPQGEVVTALSTIAPTKTILTCTAVDLALAVNHAILSNTTVSITPADIAASALEPYPLGQVTPAPRVRADRNTSGPDVTVQSINALISSTDSTFGADVGAVVDQVVVVNGTNALATTQELSAAGRAAVVEDSIQTISDAAASNTSPLSQNTLLGADNAIGTALTDDSYLEGLTVPRGALLTILEDAMLGVTGVRSAGTTVAPEAAEDFVTGIVVTGTMLPDAASDGITLTTFSQDILARVATNTSVDELVANAIGTQYNSVGDLETIAAALYAKYVTVAEIRKVTQGLAAVIAPGTDSETARIAFIQDLTATATQDKHATAVLEGAVFVDPFYAPEFTGAVMTDIYDSTTTTARGVLATGHALLIADAGGIASGVGLILGQDGNVLAEVSGTFSDFLASGQLPSASVGVYATDLIRGAVAAVAATAIPISQFIDANTQAGVNDAGGGHLALTTGVGIVGRATTSAPVATVTDLAYIVDLLANGVITQAEKDGEFTSAANQRKIAAQLGVLIADVARFTGSEMFATTDLSAPNNLVAAYLAGTFAHSVFDTISALSLGSATATIETDINNDITADVRGVVVGATLKNDVSTSVANAVADYPVVGVGDISVVETAVTNL